MQIIKRYRSLSGLALIALAGCSTIQSVDRIETHAETLQGESQAKQNLFQRLTSDTQRQIGTYVDRPWITGKPQPLARDVTLPPALRAKVQTTMLFTSGADNLTGLAQRIYETTGIPVRVSPDALLPAEAFMPRLASELSSAKFITPLPSDADTLVPAITGVYSVTDRTDGPGYTASDTTQSIMMTLPPGQAPLATVLDAISLRLGIYWRYDADLSAIEFYRTETRSFNIRALALAANTDLELGLTGSGGGTARTGGGQFESRNTTGFKSETDQSALLAVAANVEQHLSRAGVIKSPSGGTNTIVVTDTRDALDRIARFIDQENKALTRRVRIHIQEVTVQREDAGQSAIDWSVLYSSAGQAATGTLGAMAGMLDSSLSAGSMAGSVGSGQWTGTGLSLTALAQLGTVLNTTDYSMLVVNRRSSTYAMRDSFHYIRDLQQTQSTSDSNAPTVTVTQESDTVGTFLTLVPDAQSDGQVLLTLSYDNTRLTDLDRVEFGDPKNPSFVQQPKINGVGNIQQIELRPGQPTLVSAISRNSSSSTRRRLDHKAPIALGGSDAMQQTDLITLLVVTAIPEEGL